MGYLKKINLLVEKKKENSLAFQATKKLKKLPLLRHLNRTFFN
jgi:hypothetical protein